MMLAIGEAIYLSSARAAERKDSLESDVDLFTDVMQKVRAEYVDGTNLTYRNLTSTAIKGMINSLDPHSEFLDAQHYQQLQNDTEGQFGGLGLVVSLRDGYVTVVAPMEDTPGFRAGIMAGDRIVKVNGKDVGHLQLGGVVDQLRGEPGTKVAMTVQRPATGEEKTYTLTRAIIQMDMVKDINGKKDFPLGPASTTAAGSSTRPAAPGAQPAASRAAVARVESTRTPIRARISRAARRMASIASSGHNTLAGACICRSAFVALEDLVSAHATTRMTASSPAPRSPG